MSTIDDRVSKLKSQVYAMQSEIAFLRDVNARLERSIMKDATSEERAIISVQEAAQLCGRSQQIVRTWAKRFKIGILDSNGVWHIFKTDLIGLLQAKFPTAELPAALRRKA